MLQLLPIMRHYSRSRFGKRTQNIIHVTQHNTIQRRKVEAETLFSAGTEKSQLPARHGEVSSSKLFHPLLWWYAHSGYLASVDARDAPVPTPFCKTIAYYAGIMLDA